MQLDRRERIPFGQALRSKQSVASFLEPGNKGAYCKTSERYQGSKIGSQIAFMRIKSPKKCCEKPLKCCTQRGGPYQIQPLSATDKVLTWAVRFAKTPELLTGYSDMYFGECPSVAFSISGPGFPKSGCAYISRFCSKLSNSWFETATDPFAANWAVSPGK